jgi:prepilin-type N-terminal cleavage/methylation domain-containing protein
MPFAATYKRNDGFTLIELVVVISLISLVLFFAFPRFQATVLQDSTKQVSRWIVFKVQGLKEKAIREQRLYVLHIDLDANMMWITHGAMSEEERQTAQANGYRLPNDIKLLDVEYADEIKASAGQADIHFYAKGFSDKAVVHIENSRNQKRSFVIEPFLSRVRMYQKYVGLNG